MDQADENSESRELSQTNDSQEPPPDSEGSSAVLPTPQDSALTPNTITSPLSALDNITSPLPATSPNPFTSPLPPTSPSHGVVRKRIRSNDTARSPSTEPTSQRRRVGESSPAAGLGVSSPAVCSINIILCFHRSFTIFVLSYQLKLTSAWLKKGTTQ